MTTVKTETELHSFIHASHTQAEQYSKSIHSINITYMQVSKFTTFAFSDLVRVLVLVLTSHAQGIYRILKITIIGNGLYLALFAL